MHGPQSLWACYGLDRRFARIYFDAGPITSGLLGVNRRNLYRDLVPVYFDGFFLDFVRDSNPVTRHRDGRVVSYASANRDCRKVAATVTTSSFGSIGRTGWVEWIWTRDVFWVVDWRLRYRRRDGFQPLASDHDARQASGRLWRVSWIMDNWCRVFCSVDVVLRRNTTLGTGFRDRSGHGGQYRYSGVSNLATPSKPRNISR